MNDEKYRTAAENAAAAALDRRILATLGGSLDNLTSLLYLVSADAEPAIVEQWVDTTYNHLRDNLDHEDLIRAVILLQHRNAEVRALSLRYLAEERS